MPNKKMYSTNKKVKPANAGSGRDLSAAGKAAAMSALTSKKAASAANKAAAMKALTSKKPSAGAAKKKK